jgi:hypothetical protein
MNVVECDVPSGSMLSRGLIERAYFHDSYRVPLSRRELNIVDIFFGIFAHHPLWMKLLLIVRNKVASFAGLDAPTASEILHAEIKDRYVIGEKIGVWPIFWFSEAPIAICAAPGSQCGGRVPERAQKSTSGWFACRLVGRADLEETCRKTPQAREARRWTSSPWVPVLAPSCAA